MKRACLIVIVFFHLLNAAAQRYSFYNLSVENGLIQSQVQAMTQDAYGHLWIGTLGGMSRYDGENFTNYNVRNGMLDNGCFAITTDEHGNIWLGGTEGLSRYDGRTFKHFRLRPTEENDGQAVKKIFSTGNNTLWCHTDKQVYKIQDGHIRSVALPDTGITVTAILPEEHALWVATNRGRIYRYQGKTWDSMFYNIPGMPKAPVHTTNVYRDSKKRLMLATTVGLFTLREDSIKVMRNNGAPIVNIPLISIAEDKSGALWLGSISGVYRLTDSSLVLYNKKNGFTDNAIQSILTDKEGSVWFGSNGQGLYRFSGAQFSIIDERSGLPSEQVTAFAPTPLGNLYMGTSEAGLFYYDKQNVIPIPLQYKNAYISALYANNEYDIWVGTIGKGLCRLKGAERIYYSIPELPANSAIITLYKDTAERLWIGTLRGAVLYENNKFTKLPGLSNPVSAFVTIGKDSVLLATDSRIYLYHNGSIVPFITNAAPDNSNAQCFALVGNKLWIGTNDNGVICYDLRTKQSFTINKSNGLQSDFIYNIITDNNNDIWVGTGYGIHKVLMQGDQPVVTFYGKEQGIAGMESNQNASCRMPDGTLWFGTTKGAVHIDPSKQLILPQPTSIVLQSVKLFGDDIRDTTYYDSLDNWYNVPYQLALPHKKNNITFTFKAITLSGSGQLLYRYRIDGLDAPWSDWTGLNSVTYSALPPGKYTLLVESKTINGEDIKSLAYPFEIITPFHKTTWFSLMIFIACILAGITIQYILNKRKQARLALVEKLRREEQAKVRQRTAEDFHDEVGNKLTRINVLTNVLSQKLGDLTPDKKRLIDQIQENTAQLYSGTKDILWSLQATNDNLFEVLHRIRDFGTELYQDTNIEFRFSGTESQWQQYKLPLDMSRNLIMIFKEALNNCLKYADATVVTMEAEMKEGHVLHIALTDNGKGFNVEEVVKGNGLNNMRNRAERLKGKLYIDSKPGKGTAINLHFRLPGRYR